MTSASSTTGRYITLVSLDPGTSFSNKCYDVRFVTNDFGNHYVVEIGNKADKMGQLESCQTIPIMETDGHELMNNEDLRKYARSIKAFVPEIVSSLTLKNLPQFRQELNRIIPRDK